MAASNEKGLVDFLDNKLVHVYPDGPVPGGETWRAAGAGAIVAKPRPNQCHFCAGPGCEQRMFQDGGHVVIHAPAP